MDSDSDSERVSEVKQKTRKPPNTAFRQQRLKAWQPILTPKTVLPLFFVITIIFAPLGGVMLWASNNVQDLMIDYSNCLELATTNSFTEIPDKYIHYNFEGGAIPDSKPQWKVIEHARNHTVFSSSVNVPVQRTCQVQFEIPTAMGPPVFMFYRMSDFYQNHRRYVQSFNEKQLNGKPQTGDQLKSADDCKPLITNSEGVPYYPCGLIANSFFNDTFSTLTQVNTSSNSNASPTYNMTENGISWSTDRNRFKTTEYNASDVVPPPNWVNLFPNGYTDDNLPNIAEWESFQNWMRTAGLPTFSKLARRNDNDVLLPGTYSVDIGFNFPVLIYDGTKSLVITTRSVLGGRNPFLGVAYLVVAGLCLGLGLLFLIKHVIKPRKMGDHTYLSWNNNGAQEPAVAVAATGRASSESALHR